MINLVVTDAVLLGDSDEAAHVDGYGPIPAELAREMVRDAVTDDETGAWLRRLYVSPATGSLTAMDSTSRFVPSGLAELLRLRDQTCRTPWCDAPIRHSDHVVRPQGQSRPHGSHPEQGRDGTQRGTHEVS